MDEQTQAIKPQLAKLVSALAKAKMSMGKLIAGEVAKVKSEKAEYSYRYADLATVLGVVDKPLAENGLVFVQYPMVTYGQGARVTVHGTLYHESGEWIEAAPLEMVSGQIDPQRVGSAITYARRYQMQAFFGLAQEDDDGESAKQQSAKPQQRPSQQTAPPPAAQQRTNGSPCHTAAPSKHTVPPVASPTPAPIESLADVEESPFGADVVPTKDEAIDLHKQAMSRYHGVGTSTFGPTWDDVRHAISTAMQVESSSQFTAPQLNALADSFKSKSRQWQTWQRAMSKGTLPPVELAFGSLPATN